jgi:adenylate cyclase 1
LLGEERFRAIDKIKTVGSTYMAAVGLIPELRILDDDDDSSAGFYLGTLVEFVFAMREKLLNINENSYNNFMLRVGKLIINLFYFHMYFIIHTLKEPFVEWDPFLTK